MRFERLSLGLLIGLSLFATGCSSEAPPAKAEAYPESTPTPTVQPPRFEEEENRTYYYVGAVSEEDQKRGVAVGKVVAYRYLGRDDDGDHVLVLVGDNGATLRKSSCSEPCRIIKSGGQRIGFSSDSIIGAAFEDAIAGHLKVYEEPKKDNKKTDRVVSSVPKAFHGAWDEIISDGCRNREARFYINSTKFYNFEVEYDVSSVKIYSENEIDIRATYLDENGSQQSTVWELRLVDAGKSLTGRKSQETFYRKCPGT